MFNLGSRGDTRYLLNLGSRGDTRYLLNSSSRDDSSSRGDSNHSGDEGGVGEKMIYFGQTYFTVSSSSHSGHHKIKSFSSKQYSRTTGRLENTNIIVRLSSEHQCLIDSHRIK